MSGKSGKLRDNRHIETELTVRRALLGLGIVISVIASAGVNRTQERQAATPPDLSGSWKATSFENIHHSPLGPQFTVQQNSGSITIADGKRTVTYKLDGSENTRTEKTGRGVTWTMRAHARFVTYALLITTKTEPAGPASGWDERK